MILHFVSFLLCNAGVFLKLYYDFFWKILNLMVSRFLVLWFLSQFVGFNVGCCRWFNFYSVSSLRFHSLHVVSVFVFSSDSADFFMSVLSPCILAVAMFSVCLLILDSRKLL